MFLVFQRVTILEENERNDAEILYESTPNERLLENRRPDPTSGKLCPTQPENRRECSIQTVPHEHTSSSTQ